MSDALVNTKKYKTSKNGLVNRFFDTISQYGAADLRKLLTEVTVKKKKIKLFILLWKANEVRRSV
jgi:hypothetical protein